MLEIPESRTIAAQLNRTLTGKKIVSAAANASAHRFALYFGDPEDYDELLTGRAVTGAEAFGGMAEITAQDRKILFSDGANVRYFAPGEPLPQKHQLHIAFDDGSSIVCTIQMYGGLWAYPESSNDNPYYIAAKEKPSPLSKQFDESYFAGIVSGAKKTLSVKALLATEQRIPGLGNGVLQDILFCARINPRTKIKSLSDEEISRLYTSIKQTLAEMAAHGGRDTEKDLFGSSGGYKTMLSAKTYAYPCPGCGGGIIRQAYLGGNVYFCPVCQPEQHL